MENRRLRAQLGVGAAADPAAAAGPAAAAEPTAAAEPGAAVSGRGAHVGGLLCTDALVSLGPGPGPNPLLEGRSQ